MTKHELAKPEIIEGFSVLKMKQEIQEKIFRETEGMTSEELCEYYRQGPELLRKSLEGDKTDTSR